MAERRMFSKRIISSDAFMDMSASAQMLYFHLSMWADDEGFVNNSKTIQRMCGADSEDMSELIKNGLVIRFESGIVAITHWKTHNYIRGDRIKPTFCTDEKALLTVGEEGVYSFAEQDSGNEGEPEREYEADTSAQSESSAQNGSETVGNNSAQAESSAQNGSETVGNNSAQSESSAQNGSETVTDTSAQAKDSTRKSESCDRATLIERYGIDNVTEYEDRFQKWSEKRGRQGMPLYSTISAWMEQDKVVNRREHSSIPDYYLSDDFLFEGF